MKTKQRESRYSMNQRGSLEQNTTYQNMCDIANAALRENFVALNAYFGKKEKIQ